jgi:hypothetical protein
LAKGSEYERMPLVLGLTGEALARFEKKLAERNAGYDKWARSPRGQQYAAAQEELNAARRSRNATRIAQAEQKYKPLRAEQESVRRELRREFNTVLDAAQQKLWAGYMLYDDVIDDFASANLTEQQKQQAFVACAVLAAMYTDEGAIQRDPYLEPSAMLSAEAIKTIKQLVLTAEQQK